MVKDTISDQFLQRWNFPHTCGALDGKHIACKAPAKSGSQYYNYKGFYSIVLMALVDAEYKFIWADLGATGAASDAQIYDTSELKEMVEAIPSDSLPPTLCPTTIRTCPTLSSGMMPLACKRR